MVRMTVDFPVLDQKEANDLLKKMFDAGLFFKGYKNYQHLCVHEYIDVKDTDAPEDMIDESFQVCSRYYNPKTIEAEMSKPANEDRTGDFFVAIEFDE